HWRSARWPCSACSSTGASSGATGCSDAAHARRAEARTRRTTIQAATANATLITASTACTTLNPVPRLSSPRLFQIRVPQTHTVHTENAYRTMDWRRVTGLHGTGGTGYLRRHGCTVDRRLHRAGEGLPGCERPPQGSGEEVRLGRRLRQRRDV